MTFIAALALTLALIVLMDAHTQNQKGINHENNP